MKYNSGNINVTVQVNKYKQSRSSKDNCLGRTISIK
jgi:hypothetical protein